MATDGWQAKLDHARNEDAIAAICNDYVGSWTAAELAELPISCKPNASFNPDSISAYAIRLIAAVGVGNRASAPMLYKLSTFFTKAALRLADVMAIAPSDRDRRRNSSSGPSSFEG
jgi:hypothetical protein